MSSIITQAYVDSLEEALVSGELQVRIGDRWITYRSVKELKEALDYARGQLAAKDGTRSAASKATAYTLGVDRGV